MRKKQMLRLMKKDQLPVPDVMDHESIFVRLLWPCFALAQVVVQRLNEVLRDMNFLPLLDEGEHVGEESVHVLVAVGSHETSQLPSFDLVKTCQKTNCSKDCVVLALTGCIVALNAELEQSKIEASDCPHPVKCMQKQLAAPRTVLRGERFG